MVHDFATPDIEYINSLEAVEPGGRRGGAQVAQGLRSSPELFYWRRHKVYELFDCEDAVVAAVGILRRIRGGGAELVQEEAHTWTFRDGRIVRFECGRDFERRSRPWARFSGTASRAPWTALASRPLLASRSLLREGVREPVVGIGGNPCEPTERKHGQKRRETEAHGQIAQPAILVHSGQIRHPTHVPHAGPPAPSDPGPQRLLGRRAVDR